MKSANQDLTEAGSSVVLSAFQKRLNSSDVLPEAWLRRNSGEYALISYINNIAGLMLSGNHEPASIFIARAAEHLRRAPPPSGSNPYHELTHRYLCHVAYHLANFSNISLADVEIPIEIANAGPQLPP
jgi:hypothetical protein